MIIRKYNMANKKCWQDRTEREKIRFTLSYSASLSSQKYPQPWGEREKERVGIPLVLSSQRRKKQFSQKEERVFFSLSPSASQETNIGGSISPEPLFCVIASFSFCHLHQKKKERRLYADQIDGSNKSPFSSSLLECCIGQ